MKKNSTSNLSVTVFLLSYNDEKLLPECLSSIRNQVYKGEVSVLLADGGSTDRTLDIAKKYHAHVISRPDLKNSPHKRVQLGIEAITTDIAVFFSADNRFQENHCLEKMITPFDTNEIAAVETLRYGFFQESSMLTKYFALIGGADPIAVALGKADRAPYDVKKWHSFGKVIRDDPFIEVVFEKDPGKIPTLGANGIAIRNSLLKKYPMKNALHTEMCMEFIKEGRHFAFVTDAHVVHEITAGIVEFCKRRLKWASMYSSTQMKRSYKVFSFPEDVLRLIGIILASFTVIIPFIRAWKGFVRKQEYAWFLHPPILIVFVLAYSMQILSQFVKKR